MVKKGTDNSAGPVSAPLKGGAKPLNSGADEPAISDSIKSLWTYPTSPVRRCTLRAHIMLHPAQVVAALDAVAALVTDEAACSKRAEREQPQNRSVEDRVDREAGP